MFLIESDIVIVLNLVILVPNLISTYALADYILESVCIMVQLDGLVLV